MALRVPSQLVRAFVFLLIGSGLGSACSSQGHEPRLDNAATRQRPVNRPRPAAAYPLLDLPALLHRQPTEFSRHIGRPRAVASGFTDPGKAAPDYTVPADSLALFELPGLKMIFSFRPGGSSVQDVLLLGPDEATLMRQTALLPAAPDYVLLPVFESRSADRLLGLRVVPKQ